MIAEGVRSAEPPKGRAEAAERTERGVLKVRILLAPPSSLLLRRLPGTHLGAASENPAIPRGFGGRALAQANRRRRVRSAKDDESRIRLCGQVRRSGFARDSPVQELRSSFASSASSRKRQTSRPRLFATTNGREFYGQAAGAPETTGFTRRAGSSGFASFGPPRQLDSRSRT